jgi:hypothetical protein
MDRQKDGKTSGWTDKWMERQVGGPTDGLKKRLTDRLKVRQAVS